MQHEVGVQSWKQKNEQRLCNHLLGTALRHTQKHVGAELNEIHERKHCAVANTNETIHTDTHEVRECEKAGARMCPTQQKSAKCPRGSTPPLGPGTGPITSHPSPGLSVAAPPTHVTHTHNVSRHVGKYHEG